MNTSDHANTKRKYVDLIKEAIAGMDKLKNKQIGTFNFVTSERLGQLGFPQETHIALKQFCENFVREFDVKTSTRNDALLSKVEIKFAELYHDSAFDTSMEKNSIMIFNILESFA